MRDVKFLKIEFLQIFHAKFQPTNFHLLTSLTSLWDDILHGLLQGFVHDIKTRDAPTKNKYFAN